MSSYPQPKITFFHVKDNASKLRLLCNYVQDEFMQGKKILIRVPNEEAAKYVDTLLWKMPEESFLPHMISNQLTEERIVITCSEHNHNQASLLFNLCPSVSPLFSQFKEIYEFFEEFHPEKMLVAQNKIQFYESNSIQLIKN